MKVRDALTADVVVAGGGSAGVAAAIGAALCGARVVMIEQYGMLGGAATISSVLTHCGFFDRAGNQVVGGVGQLFLDVLSAQKAYREDVGQVSGNRIVVLDLETTKRALDDLVTRPGLTVALHSRVIDAEMSGRTLESARFVHRGGAADVRARAFVDASGDGELSSVVGAGVITHDDKVRQLATQIIRVARVAESAPLDSSSIGAAVAAYQVDGVSFTRTRGPAVRLPSGEAMLVIDDVVADALSFFSLTDAELRSRWLAYHYVEALRRRMPGWEDAFLVATGPQLGIRESRHVVGRDTLTGRDVTAGRRREDGVARGGWPMEAHHDGRTQMSFIRDDEHYDIPLGCLRAAEIDNLWMAGRLISADRDAYSSARVMGTAFATGHAAGVAAALQAGGSAVTAPVVRQELAAQGALI